MDGFSDWPDEPDREALRQAKAAFDAGSAEAEPAFRRLADLGSTTSAIMLGFVHFDGVGVPVDKNRAFEWFRKAARSNSGYAWHQLARHLREEEALSEARDAYERAVAAGHNESAKFLASMLLNGQGGPRDFSRAKAVLKEGGRRGDPAARGILGAILVTREWYNPVSLIVGAWMSVAGIAGAVRKTTRVRRAISGDNSIVAAE